MPLLCSQDWWEAKKLADEERRADEARREAQQADAEAERKRQFERAVLAEDHARRTGNLIKREAQ